MYPFFIFLNLANLAFFFNVAFINITGFKVVFVTVIITFFVFLFFSIIFKLLHRHDRL